MISSGANLRRWRLLFLWLHLHPAAWAARQEAPAATQPVETVAEAVSHASRWIAAPQQDEPLPAFASAAEIHHRVYQTPKPLRVWIARIDLSAPDVRVVLTEPVAAAEPGAEGETLCANTLEFARHYGVQLAVNTSAFAPLRDQVAMPMDVVGLAAVAGEVYSEADDRFGSMHIARDGRVTLQGPPQVLDGAWHVIPGFRMLVDDRQVIVTQEEADTRFGGVNPRTAVGVDEAGRTLWLVVADGRQPGISEGLTLPELAALFVSLGAWDALNLDGGGSSTLVVENADRTYRVLNTPVGKGKPNTLRQVANNLGVRLTGEGPPVEEKAEKPGSMPLTDVPPVKGRRAGSDLRDAVIRSAASRRGGGYKWADDGVSKTIRYDGQVVLRASREGTYCCGATLEVFLDAYCRTRHGHDAAAGKGRWFEDWPIDRFRSLKGGWWGTNEAVNDPNLPAGIRPTIRERQVQSVLSWTGLAEPVDDYRLLQRGDFVQFWRRSGSGHSVIFWAVDREEGGDGGEDRPGRERLWYWSSQGSPRYGYPLRPGGKPVQTAGYGLNWEYLGQDIDPARVYGARLKDEPAP